MALKSFVLSKIKEGFAEDFFTYLKFQKPNGGRMHVNNFSLSYVTEFFCDLSGVEELSPCLVYSGRAVCRGGALSRAAPLCPLGSFNTALGEQAELGASSLLE